MNIYELSQSVLVSLDDTYILESYISYEQTYTCRNRFFQTFRHSLRYILSCSGQRQRHKYDTRKQDYNKACLVSLYCVSSRDNLGKHKAYEEE